MTLLRLNWEESWQKGEYTMKECFIKKRINQCEETDERTHAKKKKVIAKTEHHEQCWRTIKASVCPEHAPTWTWLNVTLEHATGAAKNKPLEPVQVNKIGLRREQATLKGLAGGRVGVFEVAWEYSPDTSAIFIWIMCRFIPKWAEGKGTVGGKMTGFNFQLYWGKEKCGREVSRKRDKGINEKEGGERGMKSQIWDEEARWRYIGFSKKNILTF